MLNSIKKHLDTASSFIVDELVQDLPDDAFKAKIKSNWCCCSIR